jgi:beta-glucosidase
MAYVVALTLLIPCRILAQLEPHVLQDGDSRDVDRWFDLHRSYVDRAREGHIRVLFIGDSLTYGWRVDGLEAWERTFAPLGAEDFGIGGDRTIDILWRVQHGELDGIAPRAVVLSIGTNDLGSRLGVDATVKGIAACVHAIRKKLPKTTIVVLGILPRGDGGPGSQMRRDVASVNARLAPLGRAPATRYLDIGSAFTRDGQVRRELFRPDLLHLSTEGYRVWAATLRPEIDALVSSSS